MHSKLKNKSLEYCFGETQIPNCLNVFTNCREQGFCLTLYKHSNNESFVYWACQDRMSDDILVIISTISHKDSVTNCYDDEAYKNRRTFRYDEMDKAVNYVFNHIKLFFKNELDYPKEIRFSTLYTLNQLNHIDVDVESLNYEDYGELVTYEDKLQELAMNLIVDDGKFYFKIYTTSNGEYENIAKLECIPNFNSETELLGQMERTLDKFIDDELEYSLLMKTNFKI